MTCIINLYPLTWTTMHERKRAVCYIIYISTVDQNDIINAYINNPFRVVLVASLISSSIIYTYATCLNANVPHIGPCPHIVSLPKLVYYTLFEFP